MTNKILHDVVTDAIYAICISNCVDPHLYSLSSNCEWICNPEHSFPTTNQLLSFRGLRQHYNRKQNYHHDSHYHYHHDSHYHYHHLTVFSFLRWPQQSSCWRTINTRHARYSSTEQIKNGNES